MNGNHGEALTISATRRYRDRVALDVRHLVFEPGATLVMGLNGAGKSTLIDAIVRVSVSAADDVRLGSTGVDGHAARAYKQQLGWMPQWFSAPPHLTVAEYLDYAAWLKEVAKPERPSAVDQALGFVSLNDRRSERVSSLSGGMVRRLGLAQALIADPSTVALDEPTVGLDVVQRRNICGIIASCAASRVVVMATHLLEDVLDISSQTPTNVVVLHEGAVRFVGTVESLTDATEATIDRLRAGYLAATGSTWEQ